jgi:hypothetical protein
MWPMRATNEGGDWVLAYAPSLPCSRRLRRERQMRGRESQGRSRVQGQARLDALEIGRLGAAG